MENKELVLQPRAYDSWPHTRDSLSPGSVSFPQASSCLRDSVLPPSSPMPSSPRRGYGEAVTTVCKAETLTFDKSAFKP